MIDFHAHFLPGIDDGADTVETSCAMLQDAYGQGVASILATPHFYAFETNVADFLKSRSEAYDQLQKHLNEKNVTDIPAIYPGAEVLLCPQLMQIDDLTPLCINDTNRLLLEMPFMFWNDWVFRAVTQIIENHELVPVIAHLDRYLDSNKQNISRLLDLDVRIQINADSLCYFGMRRKLKPLLNSGRIHAVGSDAHNMQERRSHIGKAAHILQRKQPEIWAFIQRTSGELAGISSL